MSDEIDVSLAPQRLQVAPGETAETMATVKNAGDVVEVYSVVVEGIDPEWCTLSKTSFQLFPGDQEQVRLTIQPPRTSAGKAGAYDVAVKVVSSRDPTVETTVPLALEVGRFLQFDLDLVPRRAKGRTGSYRVSITNSGNVTTNYNLMAKDPGDACHFDFKPQSLTVEPGSSAEVPLIVDPLKKPFAIRSKTYRFKITVTSHASESGETKSVEGELVCTPLLPKWAVGLAVLALAAVIAVPIALAPGPPGVGTIDIKSSPSGAKVYLDGSQQGTTPRMIADVEEGEHDLLLTLFHYYDRLGTVQVIAGETTDVTWSLTRVPDTRIIVKPDAARMKDATLIHLLSNPVHYDGDDVTVDEAYLFVGSGELGGIGRAVASSRLEFDLSGIPDTAVVTSAKLGLYCQNWQQVRYISVDLSQTLRWSAEGTGSPTPDGLQLLVPIGVYQVTGSWEEKKITRDGQTTADVPADTVKDVPTEEGNYLIMVWDITELVQGWVDGSIENYGVEVRNTDETVNAFMIFFSSDAEAPELRPELAIEYHDPSLTS